VTTINYHRGGSGEPLVLIHGIGSRWEMWNPVLARLEAERDVIAIDLPGFGNSPRPIADLPAGPVTLQRLVTELFDELGLDRPHAAGNSMGGLLALELAKAGRARSATALSPAGFYQGADAAFCKWSLVGAVRLARALRPAAGPIAATPVGRAAFSQFFYRPWRIPPADFLLTFHGLTDATWFDETVAPLAAYRFTGGEQIDVPVTVAWGQHDRLLLVRQAYRASQRIPQGKHITLYGCGHVPTFDDPVQVAEVLLAGSAN
jgi:pimeloyl-ACP methyl ester carboxylesterase